MYSIFPIRILPSWPQRIVIKNSLEYKAYD